MNKITGEGCFFSYWMEEGNIYALWYNHNEYHQAQDKNIRCLKRPQLKRSLWPHQLEWSERSHEVSTSDFKNMVDQVI